MIAIYDITKKVWSITDVPTEPLLEKELVLPVKIGFTDNGSLEKQFNNLSFGIDLSDDGAPDKSILSLPQNGETIVASDQEFEYSGNITSLDVGISTLTFWAENDGVKTESSVDVVIKSAVYVLVESDVALGDSQISVPVITPPDPSNAEGPPPVDLP